MARPMPTAKTLLGAVLRECAEDEGSIHALAVAIGVHRKSVDDIIANDGTPTAMTFSLVAAYLELPMDTVWAWHAVRECC